VVSNLPCGTISTNSKLAYYRHVQCEKKLCHYFIHSEVLRSVVFVCLFVGSFVCSLTSPSNGSGGAINVVAVRQAIGQDVRETFRENNYVKYNLQHVHGGRPQPLSRASNYCSHMMTDGRTGDQHRSGIAGARWRLCLRSLFVVFNIFF